MLADYVDGITQAIMWAFCAIAVVTCKPFRIPVDCNKHVLAKSSGLQGWQNSTFHTLFDIACVLCYAYSIQLESRNGLHDI